MQYKHKWKIKYRSHKPTTIHFNQNNLKEITLTTYVEGFLPHLRTVIKLRHFETPKNAMKASMGVGRKYFQRGFWSRNTLNLINNIHF